MLTAAFTLMAVDVFAAVSDSDRIERARKDQAPNALKADAIPAAIETAVAGQRRASYFLSLDIKAIAKAPRDFKESECLRVARFLEVTDRRCREAPRLPETPERSTEARPEVRETRVGRGTSAPPATPASARESTLKQAACGACSSRRLEAKIGKFGPYLTCLDCGKNTAVRVSCEACGSKVYMERADAGYAGQCERCGREHVVHVDGGCSCCGSRHLPF